VTVLTPSARAEAQRILDRAALRLLRARLEEARLDGDPAVTASGRDEGPLDHGTDEGSALVEGEQVPVVGGQRDDRPNGGL
jgi:hypothetical protein